MWKDRQTTHMEQLRVIEVDTLSLRGLSPYLWAVYNFFQRQSCGKGEWLLTDTPSITPTSHHPQNWRKWQTRSRMYTTTLTVSLCFSSSSWHTVKSEENHEGHSQKLLTSSSQRSAVQTEGREFGSQNQCGKPGVGAHVCCPSTVGGTDGSQ